MADEQVQRFNVLMEEIRGHMKAAAEWNSVITTKIDVLSSDVAVLKEDVAILKIDVSVLKTDVAVLKTDVAVLKTDVAVLKTDMRNVKTRLTRLEVSRPNGVATRIAKRSATKKAPKSRK